MAGSTSILFLSVGHGAEGNSWENNKVLAKGVEDAAKDRGIVPVYRQQSPIAIDVYDFALDVSPLCYQSYVYRYC